MSASLRNNGFYGKIIPRRKPYIDKQNEKERLIFAKTFVTEDNAF